ncbi:MAG: DUF2721 domain-containing protein [Pirellulales bacterium]
METIGDNSFGLLTFLVAPAILTNATSILVRSPSNRFGLAVDPVNSIAADVETRLKTSAPGLEERRSHLKIARRRVLLLLRALTALNFTFGSFITAGMIALLDAVLLLAQRHVLRHITLIISATAGLADVCGFAVGCTLLLRESRSAFNLLSDKTDFFWPDIKG